MNKKELKIRNLLGYENYHLYSENNFENWKLFKRYEDFGRYISNENKPIMTSETNTVDELYKFAKEHHRPDKGMAVSKTFIVIAIINLFISIINMFLKIEYLRGFIMGINLVIIIVAWIMIIVNNKIMKVIDLEFEEEMKKFKESQE